jgi:hypothetical protein
MDKFNDPATTSEVESALAEAIVDTMNTVHGSVLVKKTQVTITSVTLAEEAAATRLLAVDGGLEVLDAAADVRQLASSGINFEYALKTTNLAADLEAVEGIDNSVMAANVAKEIKEVPGLNAVTVESAAVSPISVEGGTTAAPTPLPTAEPTPAPTEYVEYSFLEHAIKFLLGTIVVLALGALAYFIYLKLTTPKEKKAKTRGVLPRNDFAPPAQNFSAPEPMFAAPEPVEQFEAPLSPTYMAQPMYMPAAPGSPLGSYASPYDAPYGQGSYVPMAPSMNYAQGYTGMPMGPPPGSLGYGGMPMAQGGYGQMPMTSGFGY